MITFSKEYKVRDEGEKKAGKFYLAAAIICAVAVAAAFIVFAIVGRTNAYQNMTIPNFQAALDSGNYEEALSIYRSVQDEVLSASPEDAGKFTTQTQMLAEMEAIVADLRSYISGLMIFVSVSFSAIRRSLMSCSSLTSSSP